MSATDLNLRLVERLIRSLSSDDAFERRDAIENLALLTQQRLDYRWSGDESERADSVARWKKWLERTTKQREGKRIEAKIQILASGNVSPSELEQHLKDLPPKHKQALVEQLIKKLAASASFGALEAVTCEICGKRPPSVRITSLQPDGGYERQAACELCAARLR
jgi:hypothetical protein